MIYVKSRPHEFLVVGRNGQLRNLGTAASSFLRPGSSYLKVPSTKQEACFELTQESRDGIPLRFKGLVLYRIVDPIPVSRLFDFDGQFALQGLRDLIAHVCMGELRDEASHRTMQECVEHRKSALSRAVETALRAVANPENGASWGIELDLVQVAQVYIVDEELRRKLEVELRNAVTARSSRSDIQLEEETRLAQRASDRRMEEESLSAERARVEREKEKLHLARALDLERLDVDTDVRVQRAQRERAVLAEEAETQRRANERTALEVEGGLIARRAEQELHQERLALEQVPQIAEAIGSIYHGTTLSLYGVEAPFRELAPLVDLLASRLRGVR